MPRLCLLLLALLVPRLLAADSAADSKDLLTQAENAYANYRYHEALRALDALPKSARSVPALRCRGLALYRLGQWEAAIEAFTQALGLEPNNPDLLVDLAGAQGSAALDSGPFGKFTGARRARATLEQAVELAPSHVDARVGLFSYYLQAPGIVGGGRDKAMAQLAELERLDPIAALLSRAEVAWADDDADGALAGYRQAQEQAPQDFRAFYGFGRIAALSGRQLDAGIASLQTALNLPVHPRTPGLPGVYLRLGDIYRNKRDIPAARAAYQASLAVDPEYRFARAELDELDEG